MTNANEYLEQNYPQDGVCQINESIGLIGFVDNKGKRRSEITSLNVTQKELVGTLDLSDFINLEELYCWDNQLTNIDLTNNHRLTWLNCRNNQLRFLNVNNCLNLEELYASNNQLVSLNLNNSELVELYCGNNKLNELDLPLNNQLKIIESNDCLLKAFNYAALNPNTLTNLNISDNNLPTTNINVFNHLVNLETLWIGNSDEEVIKNNIYNRFFGSLASWKNLTKLKSIYISNTDINTGVEFLSPSITEIYYSTKERPTCQLKLIEQKITEWLEKKQLTNQSDLHKSDMLKTEVTLIEEVVEDLEISY